MDFLKQKGPLAREFCNTLIYIISLVSLKPSSLQRVLTELQWNGMWFFSLAFFAVIFMEMLSDFLLVTDRCTAWKALNGNVSEAEFHNLQQIVLCKNQKVRRISFIVLALFRLCLFPLQKTSLHFSELSSTPASHLVPSGSLGMLLSSFSEVQRIRCSSP